MSFLIHFSHHGRVVRTYSARYHGFERVFQNPGSSTRLTIKVLIVVHRLFDVIDSIRFRYYIGYLCRILPVPHIQVFSIHTILSTLFFTRYCPHRHLFHSNWTMHTSLLYHDILSSFIFPITFFPTCTPRRSHNVISIAICFVYNVRFPN